MNFKRKHFIALSLAGMGAIGAFASVSAASLLAGTSTAARDHAHTAIKGAFMAGDYQTFLDATKNMKTKEPLITEAQFNMMVEAHKLRIAGDVEGAKKLLNEAGIKPPVHGKTGKSGGFHGHVLGTTTFTDAQKEVMKQAYALFVSGKIDEAKAMLTTAGITLPVDVHKGYHMEMHVGMEQR